MDFITTNAELRSHYREPSDGAVRKEMRRLDGHARSFLGKSPFVVIGTSDAAGKGDVTPKGDRPGFVAVLDERTIAIPDRPGNNRLDTLENLLVDPTIGLLFLIPGMDETLRINGTARITVDDGLRSRLAVDGKLPTSVIVVSIDAVYMHCAKAFMRSALWNPETWFDRKAMPTLGQILKDQLALAESANDIDRSLASGYQKNMW